MAWIELHQELPRHPKTVRLLAALKWTAAQRAAAVGHLCCLWLWAMDFADADGDLDELQALEIAAGAEWAGDADQFAAALVKAGWLDQVQEAAPLTGDGARYRIHNWEQYIGRLAERREHNRQRQELKRARDKQHRSNELSALRAADESATYGVSHASVTRDKPVTVTPLSQPSHPNRTEPNQTKQTAFGEAAVVPAGSSTTAAPTAPKANSSSEEKQHAETATDTQGKAAESRNATGTAGAGEKPRLDAGLATASPARSQLPQQAGTVGRVLPAAGVPAPNPTAVRSDAAGSRRRVPVETRNAKPDSQGLNREFFDTLGYALRLAGGDGDARRLLGWLIETYPNAQSNFDLIVLARYLAARAGMKRPPDKDPVKDPTAYTIAWCENADASQRNREPYENFVQEANAQLKRARERVTLLDTTAKARHANFMADLVKAWTEKAKPREAAGVGV